MARRGFFVCVEGLDGCGKTTQARLLVKQLKWKGHDAIYTTEPSHGKIGTLIRRHCLNRDERVSTIIEALLFAADRFDHVTALVKPAINDGRLVVSDRYVYSSLAYQGAAGLDLDWIKNINVHAIPPDLAIFIDVEPETVMKRLKPFRSVMENLKIQRSVREVYMKLVGNGELTRIDGNRSKREISADLLRLVLDSIKT